MDAARTEATDRVRLQQMLDELVAAGAMGALAQFRDGDSTWDGLICPELSGQRICG